VRSSISQMPKATYCTFVVIVCITIAGCGPTQPTSSGVTDSSGKSVPAWVQDDSDLLLYRCGKPDAVLDTSQDDPRPPIPSRLLTYSKAHLRIAYVPREGMEVPPPYHWKIMGVIDLRNNHAVKADDLNATLQKRLPCMLKNPE
jgi:hypothetical protein